MCIYNGKKATTRERIIIKTGKRIGGEKKTFQRKCLKNQIEMQQWKGQQKGMAKKKTKSTFIKCKNQKGTNEYDERKMYTRCGNKQQLRVIYNGT